MNQPLIHPVPRVVIGLGAMIVLIEALFWLTSTGIIFPPEAAGWRIGAIQSFAVYDQLFDFAVERREASWDQIKRFVFYPFLHRSWIDAAFGAVIVLAIGNYVGRVLSPIATLVVFFGSSILGALTFCLIVNDPFPLFGAYPAGYGLIGAYTWVLWQRLGAMGDNQLNAFRLIGFLLGIQLVFGILFGTSMSWIAELAAFVVGFALTPMLVPGGWARMLSRLRND
jgi:membrane associated rhomboid family serine protease